jgi:hypothetical protein
MYCCPSEPPLKDILADPVVRALMTADRIDPRRLAIFLQDMARRVERGSPAAAESAGN